MSHVRAKWSGAVVCGLLVLAAGCGSSEPAAPAKDQAMATSPAPSVTDADRLAFYQRCWQLFSAHNYAEFKTCYAGNATSQQIGYGKPNVSGSDAIVASTEAFAKAFPDVSGEGQLILVNGPRIASIFILKGTNSGPMMTPDGHSMPATNKKMAVFFGHAVTLDPAALKVTKEIGVNDSGTVAAQLGMTKMPARPYMEHGAASPTIVMAKHDAVESANLATEAAQLQAWNKHDAAGVKAYASEKLVFHDMGMPADQNLTENLASMSELWKGFSDLKLTYADTWAAGDYVFMTGTLDGTNDGVFAPMNIKKTGKKLSLPFLSIDRLSDGKVVESWLFYDTASMAGQMGLGGM